MTPGEAPASSVAMASPLRVEVTFEYTFEELREGLTQSPDIKVHKRAPRALQLIGWLLFLVFAAILVLVTYANSTVPPRPRGQLTQPLVPEAPDSPSPSLPRSSSAPSRR